MSHCYQVVLYENLCFVFPDLRASLHAWCCQCSSVLEQDAVCPGISHVKKNPSVSSGTTFLCLSPFEWKRKSVKVTNRPESAYEWQKKWPKEWRFICIFKCFDWPAFLAGLFSAPFPVAVFPYHHMERQEDAFIIFTAACVWTRRFQTAKRGL